MSVVNPAPLAPQETVKQPTSAIEDVIWQHLIGSGYSNVQTAGIMGNLWQEHTFKTSDVPGGLGIAQWTGSRRTKLLNKSNYNDITVQLDYLIEELDTTEYRAKVAITSASTIEDATVAFQNNFERCNPQYCMTDKRVAYAQQYLTNHQ